MFLNQDENSRELPTVGGYGGEDEALLGSFDHACGGRLARNFINRICDLDEAALRFSSVGESAFLVAEQLRFQEV